MMGKIQTRMLVTIFVVTTFVSTQLSALGQKASPVAPTKAQVEAVVREAYDKFQSNTSGKNADYIPFLAQVDSKMFGVAVVSTDNQVFSIGETNYAFSIQSISKVYTLALAMEELGADRVFERIDAPRPADRHRTVRIVHAWRWPVLHQARPRLPAAQRVSRCSGCRAGHARKKSLCFANAHIGNLQELQIRHCQSGREHAR